MKSENAICIIACYIHNCIYCAIFLGSGKTLAFLLPIIEQVHGYNSVYGRSRAPNRPLGVVVTPSRELADQIYVR